jgi:hypothetical protein
MLTGLYQANYATVNTAGDLGPIAGPSNFFHDLQDSNKDREITTETFIPNYLDFAEPDGCVNPRDIEGTGQDANELEMSSVLDGDDGVQMVSAE